MSKFNVEITLTEEMLGTLPGDPEVYEKWILSKIDDPAQRDEAKKVEVKNLPELLEKSTTGFAKNNGRPLIYGYMIKGFLKAACYAMKQVDDSESEGLQAHRKKIDTLVFVTPKEIVAEIPEGKSVKFCVRPLRITNGQGERVTLARSETLPIGTKFTFTINCLSDKLDKYVEEWLDYGQFNALGQWRNSGKGTFTYRIIK